MFREKNHQSGNKKPAAPNQVFLGSPSDVILPSGSLRTGSHPRCHGQLCESLPRFHLQFLCLGGCGLWVYMAVGQHFGRLTMSSKVVYSCLFASISVHVWYVTFLFSGAMTHVLPSVGRPWAAGCGGMTSIHWQFRRSRVLTM